MINLKLKKYIFYNNSHIKTLFFYLRYLYSFNGFKKFSKNYKNRVIDTSIISLEDLYAMEVEHLTYGVEIDFKLFLNKKIYNVLCITYNSFFSIFNNKLFFFKIQYTHKYTKYDSKILFNTISNNYFLLDTASIFMTNYNLIDHIRYFNIEIKNYLTLDNLTFYNLLRQRYGIGSYTSKLLLNYLGVSYNTIPKLLPINDFYYELSFFFSSRLLKLDNYLLNFYIVRHSFIKKLKIYRGFRLLRGYPSMGQRTRSNYKTSLKKPYYYSFYFI